MAGTGAGPDTPPAPPYGLDPGPPAAGDGAARDALAELRAAHSQEPIPFLAAVEDPHAPAPFRDEARRLGEGVRDMLVLGTGGSSLGGQALAALAQGPGRTPPAGRPRVRFADNVDPEPFAALLGRLDPAATSVLAVSKSGATAETLAQAAAALAWMREGEADPAARALALAGPGDSPLRAMAEAGGIPVLDHHPGIGGRFSVLTATGLLPALVAGVDVDAVLQGARALLGPVLRGEALPPPAAGAAWAAAHEKAGIRVLVTAVYGDALLPLAMWHRQLWAESLGKEGRGTLPAVARGTVDQHSQLQLYLGGPADKMFTFLFREPAGDGPLVTAGPGVPGWLADRGLGEIFRAQGRAVLDALRAAGRPVRAFTVPADARAVGGLMMHFMVETVLAARLLGVDPYGQPEVEDAKRRAQRLLREEG